MSCEFSIFFFNDTATTEIYTLSLHDALPISLDRILTGHEHDRDGRGGSLGGPHRKTIADDHSHLAANQIGREVRQPIQLIVRPRSEEHTSELQSRQYLVCRLLLEQ